MQGAPQGRTLPRKEDQRLPYQQGGQQQPNTGLGSQIRQFSQATSTRYLPLAAGVQVQGDRVLRGGVRQGAMSQLSSATLCWLLR